MTQPTAEQADMSWPPPTHLPPPPATVTDNGARHHDGATSPRAEENRASR